MTDAMKARSATHPSEFTASQRASIARAKGTECYAEIAETIVKPTTALGVQTASAATTCGYKYGMYKMYSAGVNTATSHINSHMCWNGSKVWLNGYIHCYMTTIPGFITSKPWCGTINNNTALATNRHDFGVATVATPWWWRYGWHTFKLEGTGRQFGNSGFCCQ